MARLKQGGGFSCIHGRIIKVEFGHFSQEFFEETLNLTFPEVHKDGFRNVLKINPQEGGMTSRESTK